MEKRPEKILFAILDWGLGHATRSMPLIQKYKDKGAKITIAGSGKSLQFLQERFPDCSSILLNDSRLRYGKRNSIFTWFRILWAMFLNFRMERWFVQQLKTTDFDRIISDNRYGFFHPEIYSVFISHQYRIKLPKGFQLFSRIIWRISDNLISRFDEFWIPDEKGSNSLSGALSQSCTLEKAKFIGYLSRFNLPLEESTKDFSKYEVLLILSGLEPQRSILLKLIAAKMEDLGKKTLIIGAREKKNLLTDNNTKQLSKCRKEFCHFVFNQNITKTCITNTIPVRYIFCQYVWHLDDANFTEAVKQIPYIIARSGYSTVMDLSVLERKALLVPTPNQSEQEYLAKYLAQNHNFTYCRQKDIEKWQKIPD